MTEIAGGLCEGQGVCGSIESDQRAASKMVQLLCRILVLALELAEIAGGLCEVIMKYK
mgnify:CR=1 FL=1